MGEPPSKAGAEYVIWALLDHVVDTAITVAGPGTVGARKVGDACEGTDAPTALLAISVNS